MTMKNLADITLTKGGSLFNALNEHAHETALGVGAKVDVYDESTGSVRTWMMATETVDGDDVVVGREWE